MQEMTAKIKYLLVTVTILTFAFITSCDKNRVYEKSKSIEENRWFVDDFVRFNVNIPDNSIPYNFYIIVRNSTDYPYSNIYFFIRTKLPDGTVLADTVNVPLAEPDGKWLGRGIGKYREVTIRMIEGSRFPQQGEYVYEFEQAMRQDVLEGINAVGIRIEKLNQNK